MSDDRSEHVPDANELHDADPDDDEFNADAGDNTGGNTDADDGEEEDVTELFADPIGDQDPLGIKDEHEDDEFDDARFPDGNTDDGDDSDDAGDDTDAPAGAGVTIPGDEDNDTDADDAGDADAGDAGDDGEDEEDVTELFADPIGDPNPHDDAASYDDTDDAEPTDDNDADTDAGDTDDAPAGAEVTTPGEDDADTDTDADTGDMIEFDPDEDTDDDAGDDTHNDAENHDTDNNEDADDNADTDDSDGNPKGSMGITAEQPDDEDYVQATTWEDARGIPDRDYISKRVVPSAGGYLRAVQGHFYNVTCVADKIAWVSGGNEKITTDDTAPDTPGPTTDVHGEVEAGYATYKTETDDGDEFVKTVDTIINADLKVEAVLEYPNDPDADIEILLEVAPTSAYHDPVTVQAPMSALETARAFRETILSEVPGVVLNGGQNAVNVIKKIISADMHGAPKKYAHDRITTVEVEDETRLVTPHGTLAADGWVPEDDREHIWSDSAKRSGVIEMWDLGADTLDTDALDTDLAATAAEKLAAVRDPNRERWLSIVGYVTASTHRPTLTNPSNSPIQHWSILSVAGQADSGKSASLEKLMAALGAGSSGDLLTLSDTTPQALLDATTASDVVTLGIDEYDSSQIDARKIDKLHNYAKSASTGELVKKSDSNYGDHTWHVDSPLIISGEQQLDRSLASLTTRSIEIPFSRSPTHEGSPGRRAFHDLAALTDDDGRPAELHHALALWQHELAFDSDEAQVHAEWRDAAEWARDTLADRGLAWGDEITSERIMQHAETLAFGLRRYRAFCEEIGAQIDLSDEQIADALEYAMEQKVGEGAANTNNMDRFFELLASANHASIDYVDKFEPIETWYSDDAYVSIGDEIDYVHVQHDSKQTRLRVHPKDAIAGVSRYARDHGLDVDIPDASTLRNWVEQAADDPDSYAEGVGLRTNNRRHIGVYLDDLIEQIDVARVDIYAPARAGDEDDDEKYDDDVVDADKDHTTGEMSQAERRGVIRRLVKARDTEDSYADQDEIVQLAAAAANCGETKIEHAIRKMRKNGELYEPSNGELAVT